MRCVTYACNWPLRCIGQCLFESFIEWIVACVIEDIMVWCRWTRMHAIIHFYWSDTAPQMVTVEMWTCTGGHGTSPINTAVSHLGIVGHGLFIFLFFLHVLSEHRVICNQNRNSCNKKKIAQMCMWVWYDTCMYMTSLDLVLTHPHLYIHLRSWCIM